MLYLVGIFRTSSPGDGLSSNPERTAPRRWGEEPGYREVLLEMASSLNIKRLLFIKENQISQVKEFSAFLCMGRCKSLGSLISFLLYESQLSWVSSPVFVFIFTVWWLLRQRYCSPSWVPLGLISSQGWLESMTTITPFVMGSAEKKRASWAVRQGGKERVTGS